MHFFNNLVVAIIIGFIFCQPVFAAAVPQLDQRQTMALQSQIKQKFAISDVEARLRAETLNSNLQRLELMRQEADQKGLTLILQEMESAKTLYQPIENIDSSTVMLFNTAQLVAIGGVNHPTAQVFVFYSVLADMAVIFRLDMASRVTQLAFVDGSRFLNPDGLASIYQGWMDAKTSDDNFTRMQDRLYRVAAQAERLFPFYSPQPLALLPPALKAPDAFADAALLYARSRNFNANLHSLVADPKYADLAALLTAWMNYFIGGNPSLLADIGITPDRNIATWIGQFSASQREKIKMVFVQEWPDRFWLVLQHPTEPEAVIAAYASKAVKPPTMSFSAFRFFDANRLLRSFQEQIR